MNTLLNTSCLRSRRFPQRALGWMLILASVCCLGLERMAPAQEPLPQPGKLGEQKLADQYLAPPKPAQVFRLESEPALMERMAREAAQGENPLGLSYQFVPPNYPPSLPPGVVERPWAPLGEIVEPAYLCYGRLYFEQINQERYGWDLGCLQPLISAGLFYADLAMLPYNAAVDPLRRFECNTGYALPGDPMPLLLYLPEPSLTGALAEATAIGLMFVIFP
jgi:hypothetical protein